MNGRPVTDRRRRSHLRAMMVVTFSAFFYLAFVLVGLTHSLGGHFDEFIQPGTKYTFPDNIRRHGASMDTPRGESGWDGQFYYYIADDPLALRDTSAHLDMPRYRYERIGVPLVAYVGSSLAGRGWVSPKFYFATCVALILLASYVLALYVSRAGLSPYWVLLWSLGGAPLFSVCFGFVDGAADALLIIAVVAFLDDRRRWYVLFMTLAILGRESYAVVAISLALVSLSRDLLATSRVEHRLRLGTIVSGVSLQWIHAVPVVVTLAWQLYLNVHLTEGFPVMPGLLAFPFASALHYFLQSVGGQTLSTLDLPGHHLELTFPRYSQAVGLGCFIALVFFAIFRSLHDFVRSRALNKYGTALSSLAAGIALMGLYACLGPTMVWEPVGYVKAASLVWALYLVSAAGLRSRPSSVVGLAAFGIAVFGAYSIYDRVSQPAPLPPKVPIAWVTTQPRCVGQPEARIEVESLKIGRLSKSAHWPLARGNLARIRITNLASVPLEPYQGPGTINAGYQWFSADGQSIAQDGVRVPIPRAIRQGESASVEFPFDFPSKRGQFRMRLSLVQEGCSWLYALNPAIAVDLPFDLR